MTDEADEDSETISQGELTIGGILGGLMTFYVVSGTVVLFIILRPLQLVQPVLDALGPFRVVGLVILAVLALFVNVVAFGFLTLNLERFQYLFE